VGSIKRNRKEVRVEADQKLLMKRFKMKKNLNEKREKPSKKITQKRQQIV